MKHAKNNPDALRVAFIALTEGRPGDALVALESELGEDRPHAQALSLATAASLQLGRPWQVLRLAGRNDLTAAAHAAIAVNLAWAHLRLGDAPGALAVLDSAPGSQMMHQGWAARASAQIELGCYQDALAAADQGLQLSPGALELTINRVTALLQLDRPADALTACETALRAYPANPLLQANRALATAGMGRFGSALDAALTCGNDDVVRGILDLAIEHHKWPDEPSRSRALDANDVRTEAVERLLRALGFRESAVDQPHPLSIPLADRLVNAGRISEAFMVIQRIPQAKRNTAHEALTARILAASGDFTAATAALRRIYSHVGAANTYFPGRLFGTDPRADAMSLYVDRRTQICFQGNWDDYPAWIDDLRRLVEDNLQQGLRAAISPYTALLLPFPAELQRRIAESHGDAHAAQVPLPSTRMPCGQPEKLHIGYLSADFRDHPTAHLIQRLFGLHDRSRFRVSAYALRPGDDSPYHRRIARDADAFVDLWQMDDETASRRVAADGVHILIDLMGYTRHGRPGILARRPAPVQINFLGMLGTVGAEYIDYLIADPMVVPEEHSSFYHEALLRLPCSCLVADDNPSLSTEAITRANEGLPDDAFVYCSFNAVKKLTPQLFDVWGRILRSVPKSVLWQLRPESETVANSLRRELANRGVDPKRLVFAPRTLKKRHLRRMALADLFLDAFVFNAATTAVDSLFAGLPLVTLRGQTFQSRIASSLLMDAGLPDLITDSHTQYETLAIKLADQPELLACYRNHLKERRCRGQLLNSARFVRYLEAGLELVWRQAQEASTPTHIDVPPFIGDEP